MGDKPGPSTGNCQLRYNQQVRTGIETRSLTIHGRTVINQDQHHHNHFYKESNKAEDGLSGFYNFALDDVPNILASRDAELELMRQKLETFTTGTGVKVVILAGMGGAGKTTLAKLYARKWKDDFDNLIWVDAETEASLETTFQDLLRTVQPMKLQHNVQINQENLSKLHNSILKRKTLWVFDNIEDFALYKRFSPKCVPPKCDPPAIIITTRIKKGWTDLTRNVVNIEKLNLVVCEYYIRLKLEGTSTSTSDIDEHWAELAEYTGGLVIALNAVLTAIVERNRTLEHGGGKTITIAAFIAQAKAKSMQEMDEPTDEPEVRSIYQRLRHLWTDTLDNLSQRPHGPLALRFLTMMAYFPPTGVPSFWFTMIAECFAINEFEVAQALALLVSWSLAEKICDKHVVHRVLQEAVIRRLGLQEVQEFLSWILPALKKFYVELRPQGKLMGYFSGTEFFLRHFEVYSNAALVRFCIEALEMGVMLCLEPLKALLAKIEEGEATVTFDIALSLLKIWKQIGDFPFEIIRRWFGQFAAERAVRKIEILTEAILFLWGNTKMMELAVEASQYFEDAICNRETNDELELVLKTMNRLANFVCSIEPSVSVALSLCPALFTTTLNLNRATGQVLELLTSLEVAQQCSSHNETVQITLMAAAAVLHQLVIFRTAECASTPVDFDQADLRKVRSELRRKIQAFTDSADENQVLHFLQIFEIDQGPIDPDTFPVRLDQLSLPCGAALAAKVYSMFRGRGEQSSRVFRRFVPLSSCDIDFVGTFEFAILYASLEENLDAYFANETIYDDHFDDFKHLRKCLKHWLRKNEYKWKSSDKVDLEGKVHAFIARAWCITNRLTQWITCCKENRRLRGITMLSEFQSDFSNTAKTFGYNSLASFQKLEALLDSKLEVDSTARQQYILFAENIVKLSIKEQQEATPYQKCKCYPAKYQTLLAQLYLSNGELNKAINITKLAFQHQLYCSQEHITGNYCTRFLVHMFYKTENPSLRIHELLTEILDGQLEFFGHGHLYSWISYIDLAIFHCLEDGDVNEAINCINCIRFPPATDGVGHSLREASVISETTAPAFTLIVYMLLWRGRHKCASELLESFTPWLDEYSRFYVVSQYNNLLHLLNAIALSQSERYFEGFCAQQMFNSKELRGQPENTFDVLSTFLNDAVRWAMRIQDCFKIQSKSKYSPDNNAEYGIMLQRNFHRLKKNRKTWFQKNLSKPIHVQFNQIVEDLLFSKGKGLTNSHWNQLIEFQNDLSWDCEFEFYPKLGSFYISSNKYTRECLISGETFVACLINDYKRGKFQRKSDETPGAWISKCVVS